MTRNLFLHMAFTANIVILVPALWSLMTGPQPSEVFDGKVQDSEGLRLLVASLWMAILLGSVAGLFWPQQFATLLIVQTVYKAMWLGVFIAPLYRSAGPDAVPWGITNVFFVIVLAYPVLYWLGTRPTH